MVRTPESLRTQRKTRKAKLAGDNKAMTNPNKYLNNLVVKKDFKRAGKTPKPCRLRKDIQAGTVLILLAGRFRGRRVVFLRQLPSGLLLVTGPYKVNGVPLKRVNQAYAIATKTKVNVSSAVSLVDKMDEKAFFAVNDVERKSFFEDNAEKTKRIPAERLTLQKNVDTKLMDVVKSTPHMKHYLANRFALKNGDKPHSMVY